MLAAGGPAGQTARGDDPGKPLRGWHDRAMFRDREEAGERLVAALRASSEAPSMVLGIPRGGVIVAAPVAAAFGVPLDVVVTRKLGAPGNPELAIGAVAAGVRVIDDGAIAVLGVTPGYLEAEIARQAREVARREAAYRAGSQAPDLTGRKVLIADDGVATGATAIAALRRARAAGASETWFAAPVGPAGAGRRLEGECDRSVILETPADLRSVGQWYGRFDQVSDAEVTAALADSREDA